MCCVRSGNQKLQERWRAEQTKRQRALKNEKTGFWFVGIYWGKFNLSNKILFLSLESFRILLKGKTST